MSESYTCIRCEKDFNESETMSSEILIGVPIHGGLFYSNVHGKLCNNCCKDMLVCFYEPRNQRIQKILDDLEKCRAKEDQNAQSL